MLKKVKFILKINYFEYENKLLIIEVSFKQTSSLKVIWNGISI